VSEILYTLDRCPLDFKALSFSLPSPALSFINICKFTAQHNNKGKPWHRNKNFSVFAVGHNTTTRESRGIEIRTLVSSLQDTTQLQRKATA
jgi:hypothetical protein